MPVAVAVSIATPSLVTDYYRQLGPEYERALRDMLLLDAVICNTDRHFGNFGFLIDNAANRIIAPAPVSRAFSFLHTLASGGEAENRSGIATFRGNPLLFDAFLLYNTQEWDFYAHWRGER